MSSTVLRALALGALLCAATLAQGAAAQQYPQPAPPPPGYGPPGPPTGPTGPGYPAPPGYQPPRPGYPYGPPPPPPPRPRKPTSTGLELGFLYGTSVAWGAGTGIWIDAEAGITDPGLAAITPIALGGVAPLGVFLVDRFAFRDGMPEGLPSAIAAGMLLGAGEGLGVATYQWVTADNPWGFVGLARAEVLGSTLGGAAGGLFYYLIEPAVESNVLLVSSGFWGAAIGSFIGGGASPAGADWSRTNDDVSAAGLIGFNVALAGATTASIWWTPSYNQLAWMWGGFGIGTAASLPVYIFYAAAKDHDPRRGLIFQGVAGTIGLGLGAMLSQPRTAPKYATLAADAGPDDRPVQLWGVSLAPFESGMGVQAVGALW